MDLRIRAVRLEDAPFINEMRRMDGVRENTLGIISERVTRSEEFIRGLSENDHLLVAEVEENGAKRVVGLMGMHVNKNPRLKHSATLGIMVHREYQRNGIGKALFEKMLDLADNWLMLKRLDLTVFTDNEKAIRLYKSMGFVIEGTKKYAAARNGRYEDEYLMARYKVD